MISMREMAEFIYDRTGVSGGTALVLGSGLGDFADRLENQVVIPYLDIPRYPRPTVEGHAGEFVFGFYRSIPVLAAKGRFHYYEGHDFHTVTLPIRLFHYLQLDRLIITNAAGSVNPDTPPGSLMLVNGHMDCTFRHGSGKARVMTGPPYYDSHVLESVKVAARNAGIDLREGIYCWTQGPAYETPEEINLFRSWGADAVGMSTVPEIIAAGELGLPTITISTLTNFAAGITDAPLTHAEVIETAAVVKSRFQTLLQALLVALKNI